MNYLQIPKRCIQNTNIFIGAQGYVFILAGKRILQVDSKNVQQKFK